MQSHELLVQHLLQFHADSPAYRASVTRIQQYAFDSFVKTVKEKYNYYNFDWADVIAFWLTSYIMFWFFSGYLGTATFITFGGAISLQAYASSEKRETVRLRLHDRWDNIWNKVCTDPPKEGSLCSKLQFIDDRKSQGTPSAAILAKIESFLFDEPSGLKWQKIEKGKPLSGKELTNAQLSEALRTKLEFTKAEWNAFNVQGLQQDYFILSHGSYFQPVKETLFTKTFDSIFVMHSTIRTKLSKLLREMFRSPVQS